MSQPAPLLTIAAMAILVLIIAWGLWTMQTIRNEARQKPTSLGTPEDLIGPIRAAYQAGQMDSAEYDRICQRLGLPRGKPDRTPTDSPTPPSPTNPLTDPSSNASHPAPD
ncbi:MAG: hypothetical protein KatS3mg108_0574 [Isosphaeraceae bacterium]|jgi:hypothetical protein|nr:MAG: hypothetical protein KatS3mg108_0574 [Isosphaeraceae bacterium]